MKTPLMLIGASALAMALLACEPGARVPPREPGRPALAAVPAPETTNVEPQVIEQLAGVRADVEALLADPATDNAVLGDAFLDLGRIYHAYGLYEAAEAAYGNALALRPNDFTAGYSLALMYQQGGRVAKSIEQFERALSQQHYYVPAMLHLAQAYREQGNEEAAGAVLERARALSPWDPAVMAALGELALSRERYSEAVRYLQGALTLVPEANRLHYPLAMAYRATGNDAAAREHLQLHGTVGLQPADPLAAQLESLRSGERVHLLKGKRAFAAGRYEDAAEAFRAAARAMPSSVPAQVNLGTSLVQTGDTEAAVQHFMEALRLDPRNVTAHFNLGELALRAGNMPRAIEHFEAVAALSPGDAEGQFKLAEALRDAGRAEEALEHYGAAARSDPQRAETWLRGSSLLFQLDRFGQGKQILEQGHEQLPNDGQIAHALARVLAASPNYAIRDGRRALSLAAAVFKALPTPRHAQTLAMAYAESGQCDEAVEWQRRAIELAANAAEVPAQTQFEQELSHYASQRPCRYPGHADSEVRADDAQSESATKRK